MKKMKIFLMTIAITSMLPISIYSGDDKEAFKALDKNNNSKIEMDEFADCITSSSFRQWDKDGNNYLSETEFKNSDIAKANMSGMKSDKSKTSSGSSTSTQSGASGSYGTTGSQSGTIGSGSGTATGSGTMGTRSQSGDMGDAGSVSESERQSSSTSSASGSKDDSHKADRGDFSSWDINSDSQLSMTELRNAAFRQYDRDSNGTLDNSEFTEVDKICDSHNLQ